MEQYEDFFKALEQTSPVPMAFEFADEHMTMVIVTHEMPFARAVSDRVVFLDGGVIVEQGSPEQVFENPQQERTREFLKSYRETSSAQA